ncbi:GNAT family N-acetyltransferase [Paenibacillus sp. FSL k6-2145]|uniref:GNAT family N-acetyltransferase n=1 Tax=Paenibacillus sp. FSL k6-2145 TaxID=2976834 RepID=UPI0030DA3270
MRIQEISVWNHDELVPVLAESSSEGFRHIERLIHEYETGINTFEQEDEALYECRMHNKVVGICGLNRDPYSEMIDTGRIRRLYVMREFRRHGVGRRLMDAVIQKAENHYARLVLYTDQPVAGSFYHNLGFREVTSMEKITHVLELGEKEDGSY